MRVDVANKQSRAFVDTAFVALLLCLPSQASAEPLSIDLRSRGSQPGDAVAVSVAATPQVTSLAVTAFGARWAAFKVNDQTWLALVGIDLERKPGAYDIVVTANGDAATSTHRSLTVEPKRFRRRVLTVAPDFVNPPPEQMARIEADSAFLRTVYARSASEPSWLHGIQRPVKEPANSSFGTRSVYNGEVRSPHTGTDFLSPAGTPIQAPAAGRVLCARNLYFTGNTVIVDHGLGVFSMLAHLSRLDVEEGQTVRQGEIVGLVGATGRVTGPHLHWALRVGSARVDPLSVVDLFALTP